MPKATVAAIIAKKKLRVVRILLTRRTVEPFTGMWCLPGGHIDQDEQAAQAIAREVKEETGVDLTPSFFGYFDEIIPSKNIHAVVLVFVGEWKGDTVLDQREVSEIGWFTVTEALSLPLAFCHKTIIETYAQSQAQPRT